MDLNGGAIKPARLEVDEMIRVTFLKKFHSVISNLKMLSPKSRFTAEPQRTLSKRREIFND